MSSTRDRYVNISQIFVHISCSPKSKSTLRFAIVAMLSLCYDADNVYYNFDDLLQLMVLADFEAVDKKSLCPTRLCVKMRNEHVFVTDGLNTTTRLLKHDECYVNLDGVIQILNTSTFGNQSAMERVLARAAHTLVEAEHPGQKKLHVTYSNAYKTRWTST
ncbi:ORF7 [Betabaculovirus altermyunipunctae]|uniref:ORF7 n=1 Tax=Betabaculovirus altermyunipunctae TaxID=3051996 RepID=A0A1S5YEC0_9BBAC|nr:ORF7 [Betabaculovirus altermyunipunctae]AQQ80277.1 ORF7 [Betabaculovirus altermyunipunctae]